MRPEKRRTTQGQEDKRKTKAGDPRRRAQSKFVAAGHRDQHARRVRYPEEPWKSQLRDIVNFDQTDPGRAIISLDHGGVGARREMREDRRFAVVVRREAG